MLVLARTKNAVVCGLARAKTGDIERCWEAVKHAERPRIHTFIGTSPLHRAIPNLDQDQMADVIHDSVTLARNLCDNVQWSPMDATRTEEDYLKRVIEIAIKAGGATTINESEELSALSICAPRDAEAGNSSSSRNTRPSLRGTPHASLTDRGSL